jgi:hypothetical protein
MLSGQMILLWKFEKTPNTALWKACAPARTQPCIYLNAEIGIDGFLIFIRHASCLVVDQIPHPLYESFTSGLL